MQLEPVKESSKDGSKSQMKATANEGRMTRRTRSQASDDESESDNSGFKLKLKILKPTPRVVVVGVSLYSFVYSLLVSRWFGFVLFKEEDIAETGKEASPPNTNTPTAHGSSSRKL